jgi:hypothetical protein
LKKNIDLAPFRMAASLAAIIKLHEGFGNICQTWLSDVELYNFKRVLINEIGFSFPPRLID